MTKYMKSHKNVSLNMIYKQKETAKDLPFLFVYKTFLHLIYHF